MRITKTFKSNAAETGLFSTAVLSDATNEYVVEVWADSDRREEVARFPFTPGAAYPVFATASALARRIAKAGV